MLSLKAALLLKTFAVFCIAVKLDTNEVDYWGGKSIHNNSVHVVATTSKKCLIYKIPEKWRLQHEILKFTDQVTPNKQQSHMINES